MKTRLLLLDNENCKVREVYCEELQDYYNELGCDCFDIAVRDIQGKKYDLYVDDIGWFRDKPIPSAVDSDNNVMLVGNIIFANHDNEGNTISLTDEDIEHIHHNIMSAIIGDKIRPILTNCNY